MSVPTCARALFARKVKALRDGAVALFDPWRVMAFRGEHGSGALYIFERKCGFAR